MKNLFGIIFFVLILSSCKNNQNRQKGFCYCKFINGDKTEYDLTEMTREDQKDACYAHDYNAGKAGGDCKLK